MKKIIQNNKLSLINEQNEVIGFVTFPFYQEGVVIIDHTFVDPNYRGQNNAHNIIIAALDHIRSNNLKVVASCPFVIKFLERNKEKYQDIIAVTEEEIAEQCKLF